MKKQAALLAIAIMIALSGCGKASDESAAGGEHEAASGNHAGGHEGMEHSDSGEVPSGLKTAAEPAFPTGSKAVLETEHMSGMKGAEATVVGAYDTIVYAVSYDSTTGKDKVANHKWVIHEELADAGEEAYEPGTKVVLKADHMEGMDGAAAVIDSAERMTVYMVDYKPVTGGEWVTNHKWVTESELSKPQQGDETVS